MAITKHNYEAYFIDYHEGRLSETESRELMDFLATHPDLKREFEAFDSMTIDPDLKMTYKFKSSIKRSEETGILLTDEKAIAVMEGDADPDTDKEFLTEIFANTKLKPDLSVSYPDPSSLKKRIVLIPPAVKYAAAAAILLLISLGGWVVFSPETNAIRMDYRIAKVESISNVLDVPGDQVTQMNFRKIENMKPLLSDREVFKIERLTGTSQNHIQTSPNLASTNMVLFFRPYSDLQSIDNSQVIAFHEPKKKTFIGKVFSGMFNKIKAPFENTVTAPDNDTNENFTFWNLAQLGVKGVNAMGDHDYTIVRDYNKKGNVKGLIVLEE